MPPTQTLPSTIVVVSNTNEQNRPSGETYSLTQALTVPSNNTPKKSKGKNKNENSLGKYVTQEEIIKIPDWDLKNVSLKKYYITRYFCKKEK